MARSKITNPNQKGRLTFGWAALILMAYVPIFTYNGGANPPIDYPRVMVSDTEQFGPDGTTSIYVFSDQEITALTQIEATLWQSGQYFSGQMGVSTTPSNPVAWNRIAARLLDSLAANKARLAAVTQILDIKLQPEKAAQELRAQAQVLRDLDDNSGAFFIAEQVNNIFSFRDRYWKTVQRQSGGGIGV